MKTVCRQDMCAGCMACIEICPRNAIQIKDDLKSYNAVIDESICVNCGLCERVCPNLNENDFKEPIIWKQGWSLDEDIRKNSASGGIAATIQRTFFNNGGNVCSCFFENGEFKFGFAKTLEDIKKFSGSKYVKSNPLGVYKPIKEKLKNGEKVLFAGLPCQVAAAKNFVGKNLEKNLYTVDLICHGTPSPKILELFLDKTKIQLSKLEDIKFRKNHLYQLFINGKSLGIEGASDSYSRAFLNTLILTENCYNCQYARRERNSDITLGDSWGSELPINEQKKGVSLVLVQTEKGKKLLRDLEVELRDVDLERTVLYNLQLKTPSKKPYNHSKFFRLLKNTGNYNRAFRVVMFNDFMKTQIKSILILLRILKIDS